MANRDCGPKSTVVMVKSVSLTDIRCGKRRKSRDNSEARTQRLKSGKCLAGVVRFPADFKFPTQPIEVAIINFATLQYVMQLCCTWMCHSQCIEPLSPCLTRSMCRRPTRGRLDEPETIRNERSAFMYCGVPLPIWRAPFFEIKLLENAVS